MLLQLISLPQNLMITDYSLGHTGSVHDAWAFRSTRTFKNHEDIFGPGEWMWADSAYPPETWSVGPFKKPVNGQLTADQKTFNYWVSKVRYKQILMLSVSLFSTDSYTRRAHSGPFEGNVPIVKGDSDSTRRCETPHDHHHVGLCLHHSTQPYHSD